MSVRVGDGLGGVLPGPDSPVVSVRVRRRLFYTLVHLRHQQTVVRVDGVAQVCAIFLFVCTVFSRNQPLMKNTVDTRACVRV